MKNSFLSILSCALSLCASLSISQESHAQPSTITIQENEQFQLEQTHAYITEVVKQTPESAKVSLDFVGVIGDGKDEYQRYLKSGYPKMSFREFEEATPGGMVVFNQRRTIRHFHTYAGTVYNAFCTSSPLANADGLVVLNQQEFLALLDKNNVSKSQWQAFHNKHNHCISQNQKLVKVTYDNANQQIKMMKFIWMP